MKTQLTGLAVALALGLAQPGLAAEVQQLGSNASAQDFIHALSPAPGTPALKFRGIRVLNANPTGANEAPAPAVAVDIKFALNSATLSDEAKETVRQIAAAMKSDQLASYHFLLEGHTDTTGSAPYNMALSKRRAEAVRDDLVKTYGIAANRLEAVGRGEQQLLDPSHPDSPVNRRVQIVNLGQ